LIVEGVAGVVMGGFASIDMTGHLRARISSRSHDENR
jgi:hypothetical protein